MTSDDSSSLDLSFFFFFRLNTVSENVDFEIDLPWSVKGITIIFHKFENDKI